MVCLVFSTCFWAAESVYNSFDFSRIPVMGVEIMTANEIFFQFFPSSHGYNFLNMIETARHKNNSMKAINSNPP